MEEYWQTLIEVSGTITYVGEAKPGSATSQAVWRIKEIDETVANNTTVKYSPNYRNFGDEWDNRATLVYN